VSGTEARHDLPAAARTWRSRRAWAALVLAAVLALGLDLGGKSLAFATIAGVPVAVDAERVRAGHPLRDLVPHHEPVVVIPRVLELTLVLNRGAVFGVGQGQRVFFIAFTVAAFAFGLWVFVAWTRPQDRVAHAGIGLLLGGGLGNLYDRVVYACVRDFLHPLPGVMWPFGWRMPLTGSREVWPYVSNLADLFLIIGIVAVMAHVWRSPRPARPGGGRAPGRAE
jgi:signal peptidase II